MTKIKDISDIKESDLYMPVQAYFESLGYEVNGEIHSCDLVAKYEEEILVVELKKTLNLEVILQAAERQKIAETVYVAVLKPKNFKKSQKYKRICHLLRRLEIGLMLVTLTTDKCHVEVVQVAESFDRHRSRQANKRKRVQLEKEFSKRKTKTTGGVTKTKIMTAYREDAVAIAKEMERLEVVKPKELIFLGLTTQRVQTILYHNHYGWFERVERGIYRITEQWLLDKQLYE
jgi:hypothetical protein